MAVTIETVVFRITTPCLRVDDHQLYTEMYFYGIRLGALTMHQL
jgi:hypothetical protein